MTIKVFEKWLGVEKTNLYLQWYQEGFDIDSDPVYSHYCDIKKLLDCNKHDRETQIAVTSQETNVNNRSDDQLVTDLLSPTEVNSSMEDPIPQTVECHPQKETDLHVDEKRFEAEDVAELITFEINIDDSEIIHIIGDRGQLDYPQYYWNNFKWI